MRKFVMLLMVVLVVCGGKLFADSKKTIIIKANIPKSNGLKVSISKVTPKGEWPSSSAIDFGQLVYNSKLGIFLAKNCYAVDVGVLSNAANWTIQYSATSITGPGKYKLDNHVNVVFVKQIDANNSVNLGKYVYGKVKSKSFSKSTLNGGWLRIYYGIATGNTKTDPPGAKPITTHVPAGDYQGQITISLTVS